MFSASGGLGLSFGISSTKCASSLRSSAASVPLAFEWLISPAEMLLVLYLAGFTRM